jgi:hypothetical protein
MNALARHLMVRFMACGRMRNAIRNGTNPIAFAAKLRAATMHSRSEFHDYIRALVTACHACNLEHGAQLNALVDPTPEDPERACSKANGPFGSAYCEAGGLDSGWIATVIAGCASGPGYR